MKYRSKLFLFTSILAFLSCLFAVVILTKETYSIIFQQIRHKGVTLASTAVIAINGDLLEKIKGVNDPPGAYQELIREMRRIRNANRGKETYVKYIYIVIPSRTEKDAFIYAIDADEEPDTPVFGTPYKYDLETLRQNEAIALQKFETDQWGLSLTSYAPIFNSKGQKVGMLGIDIDHSHLSKTIHQLLLDGGIAFGLSLIVGLIFAYFLSKLVTRSLNKLHETVETIGTGNFDAKCHLETHDEFQELAESVNKMTQGLKERERLKLGFARYVSNYVLEKILQSEVATKLEGERKKITILFTDIRQFTTLSETLTPEQVVQILNQYFTKMIQVIFRYQGTLDKFIGDGMMIEFGAPLEDERQEEHAIIAALHMQKELEGLNQIWTKENLPSLHMGIGIHTGYAVLGNVGSDQRMEYTAIGDAVNVAARLEQMTKTLKKPIIISKTTHEKTKDIFVFEDLGSMQLPGRKEEIQAFHVLMEENLGHINQKPL